MNLKSADLTHHEFWTLWEDLQRICQMQPHAASMGSEHLRTWPGLDPTHRLSYFCQNRHGTLLLTACFDSFLPVWTGSGPAPPWAWLLVWQDSSLIWFLCHLTLLLTQLLWPHLRCAMQTIWYRQSVNLFRESFHLKCEFSFPAAEKKTLNVCKRICSHSCLSPSFYLSKPQCAFTIVTGAREVSSIMKITFHVPLAAEEKAAVISCALSLPSLGINPPV